MFFRVVVIDDLSNCKENKINNEELPPSLERACIITNKKENLRFYKGSK